MLYVVYFIVGILLVSAVEYTAHRWFMHRRFSIMESSWWYHAIIHHGRFYRVFNHEEDPIGKWVNLKISWPVSINFILIFFPLYLFDWRLGLICQILAFLQTRVWNAIHVEMHVEQGRFFHKWRVYKFLKWHHFLHHRHANRNFNATLPIFDYILGTAAKCTPKDYHEWLEVHHGAVTAFPVQDDEVR